MTIKKETCNCNKLIIIILVIAASLIAAVLLWQVNQTTNVIDFRGLKGGPILEPGMTDTDMSGFTINP